MRNNWVQRTLVVQPTDISDIRCKEWCQSWWAAGWRRSDNFILWTTSSDMPDPNTIVQVPLVSWTARTTQLVLLVLWMVCTAVAFDPGMNSSSSRNLTHGTRCLCNFAWQYVANVPLTLWRYSFIISRHLQTYAAFRDIYRRTLLPSAAVCFRT